ncbi:MAG: phosphatidylglycerol lysyltransferase domain-containing protein [Bacteroidales bacterium]|jgi:hypothetical protein|nr:phosphatidylglycerol lysyltransferase domain-containing protein [Bacteroidales bacterium]
MLKFKKITLSDRALFEPRLKGLDCNMLNYNFVIQYIYRNDIDFQFAYEDDFLFLKVHTDAGKEQFLMPVGEGDIDMALDKIMEYAFSQIDNFTITQFCEHNAQYMIDWVEKHIDTHNLNYEFYPVRDEFEYMYLSEELVKLEGHILKPKRNRLNAFLRTYPDYTMEHINADNIEEVRFFSKQWIDYKFEQTQRERLKIESKALQETLNQYFAFNIDGIIIRGDGQMVAFAVGCPLNDQTYLVLFEEADTQYTGSYNIVNQKFAEIIAPNYRYINRAEDCGVEGLRRAKLAYNPCFLNKVHHLFVYKT